MNCDNTNPNITIKHVHTCRDCAQSFQTKELYTVHRETDTVCKKYKDIIFKCERCSYETKGLRNIQHHQKTGCALTRDAVTADNPNSCSQCIQLQTKLVLLAKNTELIVERVKSRIFMYLLQKNSSLNIDLNIDGMLSDIASDAVPVTPHIPEHTQTANLVNAPSAATPDCIQKNSSCVFTPASLEHPPPPISIGSVNISAVPGTHTYNQQTITKPQNYRRVVDKNIDITQIKLADAGTADVPVEPNDKRLQSVECDTIVQESTPNTQTTDCTRHPEDKQTDESFSDNKIASVSVSSTLHAICNNRASADANEAFEKSLDELYTSLKDTRVYKQILSSIKKQRIANLKTYTYESYTKIIGEHIARLTQIFSEKGMDKKKINMNVLRSLTPMETRITMPYNYHTVSLEGDDVSNFKKLLEAGTRIVSSHSDKKMFECSVIVRLMCTYNISIMPLEQILFIILKPFCNKTIVYVPLDKSKADDPYSFYTLNTVVKEKSKWDMDCRLENLVSMFKIHALPYAINIFRKIYMDVFSDNDYRKDYNRSYSQIFDTDTDQLLLNIISLSRPIHMSNMVRTVVKEHGTYNPTPDDKFNLIGDDLIQKKKFQSGEEPDVVENTIMRLFDTIKSEDAVDFYRDIKTKYEL